MCQKIETYERACCVRGYHVYRRISGEIACDCCHAMVASVATYLTPLLRLYFLYDPRFLSPVVASVTSRFAMDIAREGMATESNPSGSGSPSLCLKYRKRAVATHSLMDDRKEISLLFFLCKIIFVR